MAFSSTPYLVSFLTAASQTVPETLTKTDFCHFFFNLIMISCIIATLTIVKHQIGNCTGKCNINWKKRKSFISVLMLAFLNAHSAFVSKLVFTLASYMWRPVSIKIMKIMKINDFLFIASAFVKHLYIFSSWDSMEANGVTFQWGRAIYYVYILLLRLVYIFCM